MKVEPIPPNTLAAVITLLSPNVPDLSALTLVHALKSYETDDASPDRPFFVDKHRAARLLGVSWWTIVRMCKSGELDAVKVRGQWRVNSAAIRALAGEGS